MPRAFYRAIRESQSKHPHLIAITRRRTGTTDKQVTDQLLCAACEDRFNRGGEKWMANWGARRGRFSLLERLGLAVRGKRLTEATMYSGSTTGVETEKLGYFALSMLWRGAVHEWRGLLGERLPKLDLGGMEETVRQYLLGERPFPRDAVVLIHVCTDRTSQQSMFGPCQAMDKRTSFEMLALGIHFFIFLGTTINETLRKMCCVTSKDRPLFVRDCKSRITAHVSLLAKASKRSKKIEAEWPD